MDTEKIDAWLRQNGYTRKQIAEDLSLTRHSINQVITGHGTSKRVLQWLLVHGCPQEFVLPSMKYRNRGQSRERKIKRECLKCGDRFMALGRFNRICPKCTAVNSQYADVERYQVRG